MRIATLEELCAKPEANVARLKTLQAEESYVARRPISVTGHLAEADEKHLIPLVSSEFKVRSPSLDLYAVADALVSPNAAISTGDRIIADSLRPYLHLNDVLAQFGEHIKLAPGSDGRLDMTMSSVQRISKPMLLLRDHGEAGYFHFLHSVLPRLLLWKQRPLLDPDLDLDLHIAVTTPFQAQFLDYLKVPKERLHIAGGQSYRFDQAYMITGVVRPDWPTGGFFERPLEVTRLLRRLIPADATYSKARLYISRRDSTIRSVDNEPELERILREKFGFQPVVLSEMSPEQQIRAFAGAAIVVGAHGAGLSNAVFMKPDAILFEIFPKSRIWPTFRAIAARAGLRYAAHVTPAAERYDLEDLVPAIGRALDLA
jgi:hypothetical protein